MGVDRTVSCICTGLGCIWGVVFLNFGTGTGGFGSFGEKSRMDVMGGRGVGIESLAGGPSGSFGLGL